MTITEEDGAGTQSDGPMLPMRGFGSGPEHGQSVLATAPQFGSATFLARYVCAAYMRFEGATSTTAPGKIGATLFARHAYLELHDPNEPDSEIEMSAKKLLEAIGTNDYRNVQPIRYSDNFWRFGFNSQQAIILFVDNDPELAGFDPNAADNQIIRFCPFSGQEPNKPRRMNYAFLGLQKLDFSEVAEDLPWTRDCNTAYRLNFWNTDDNGRPIRGTVYNDPYTHYLYAMNIHLRLLATAFTPPPPIPGPQVLPPATQAFIPIILDPDTGNMGGTP
jgi:hypothetical protein